MLLLQIQSYAHECYKLLPKQHNLERNIARELGEDNTDAIVHAVMLGLVSSCWKQILKNDGQKIKDIIMVLVRSFIFMWN